ncbi:MAG TPA: homoserine dehydrogenase [Bacillales bacterium]|nr:homoserine dehydrogenase [Bacillales bacterium]
MTKERISVGLLGLGTVGSGVAKMLEDNQEEIRHKVGSPLIVDKVLVQDRLKARLVAVDEDRLTTNADEVLSDPDIDVVVEVMGGIELARKYILQALSEGKHVVTANKDLIALHGVELMQAAQENGCDLFFEASVAGGIPIIRSLVEGLASDRITKMIGIVNGTTNYMLTKMYKCRLPYSEVLKEAQEKGFAEADPSSDVDGLDAARKMAILATLGFSMNVDLDDVSVEGISELTNEDMEYSKRLGYVIKLLGIAKRENGRIEVSVQPTLLPQKHPLASVNDEYNAVYVYGEAVGETMFYGPGAGQLPTATAVVADVIAVSKNLRLGVCGKSFTPSYHEKLIKSDSEIDLKTYFRLHVKDEPGVFSKITGLFANEGVSMEKIHQNPLESEGAAEIAIVTHRTTKNAQDAVCNALAEADVVLGVKSKIRAEGD